MKKTRSQLHSPQSPKAQDSQRRRTAYRTVKTRTRKQAGATREEIIQAAKLGVNIDGATLYCTHQPCSVCAKMIVNAGIRRVVYEQGYPDSFTLEIFGETGVQLEQMESKEDA